MYRHSCSCIYVVYCVLHLFFFVMIRRPPRSTRTDTLLPYTTLFRSGAFPSSWTLSSMHCSRVYTIPALTCASCMIRPMTARSRQHGKNSKHRLWILSRTSCTRMRSSTTRTRDRQSVVLGKSVSVHVDLGGRRHIKKNTHIIIFSS